MRAGLYETPKSQLSKPAVRKLLLEGRIQPTTYCRVLLEHSMLICSLVCCFCATMRELNTYNREHVAHKAQSMTTWLSTGFCLVSHHQNVRGSSRALICWFWSLLYKDVLSGDLGDCMCPLRPGSESAGPAERHPSRIVHSCWSQLSLPLLHWLLCCKMSQVLLVEP